MMVQFVRTLAGPGELATEIERATKVVACTIVALLPPERHERVSASGIPITRNKA